MDMGMDIIKRISKKIKNNVYGNGRSTIVKKNIVLTLFFRVINVLTSFLLIPISIRFVGTEQYGIWLTISSIVAWLAFFDIGLSNGLRNKLVKALATKDFELAKIYVSTTYIALSFIFIILWSIFIFITPHINWIELFNIPNHSNESINRLILIIFSYFCLSFILKIINSILLADQKAAYSSLIDMFGQIIALVLVLCMSIYIKGSLLYLCLIMCISPLAIALIFNLFLFKKKYHNIAPSFKYFKKWCIKDLMKLSIKFFVIQAAAIIQYQTANIIIARLFNMSEVTNYNATFKYFSILSILFGIILLPLWSATTDAYVKKDYAWIRNTLKKYLYIFGVLSCLGVVMLILSNYIYNLWIGDEFISIPFTLSLWCLLYTIVNMYGSIFVNILNGIGAIRIQFIFSIITPFLYIALCVYFISYLHLGIYAVFIAAIISNINGFVIAPIQFVKIFIKNKKGIWTA